MTPQRKSKKSGGRAGSGGPPAAPVRSSRSPQAPTPVARASGEQPDSARTDGDHASTPAPAPPAKPARRRPESGRAAKPADAVKPSRRRPKPAEAAPAPEAAAPAGTGALPAGPAHAAAAPAGVLPAAVTAEAAPARARTRLRRRAAAPQPDASALIDEPTGTAATPAAGTVTVAPEAEPETAPAPEAEPAPAPTEGPSGPPAGGTRRARTPEAAFDALYVRAAGPLLRQIELLTGDPSFARRVVAHAFDVAWQCWPEVARDQDPVGWVRAAAHSYALAPWQRWVPGHRPHPRTPADPLEAALLELPQGRRRAVLLFDGLGLDLPEAAAEVEASTLATAGRITRGREELAAVVPELADEGVPVRLGALLRSDGADPDPPDRPESVRDASERGTRRRTIGAFALTGLIAALTTAAIALGQDFEPPPHPSHPDVSPTVKPIRDRTG